MKVVVINGAAESGKDKFIRCIRDNVSKLNIFNLSTIYPSKEALKILGWDGERKTEENRQAMVDLKRISMKLFNGPFEYIRKEVNICLNIADHEMRGKIFFVHCREPEEIQKFVDHYRENCITLLIRSPRGKALKNGSDDVVENYDYNYIIENSETLDELKVKAIAFAKKHLIQE